MFITKSPNSHGWVPPSQVESLWKDQFEYHFREETGDFIFPITIHPDVSGYPQVLLMLERFIEWIREFEGVEFVTMKQMGDYFRANNPAPEGAVMPAGM